MGKRKSNNWQQRQQRDHYVKQAKMQGYRSRAVYKLAQIDRKDKLFCKNMTVVDIGAAPGGWSQYAAEQVGPGGRVVAIDILTMPEIVGVEFVQGDFLDLQTIDLMKRRLAKEHSDLVISDMAPNLSGNDVTDQARSMNLAQRVVAFSKHALKPRGTLLIKLFEGPEIKPFRDSLKDMFETTSIRKPDASRSQSREIYLLAQNRR